MAYGSYFNIGLMRRPKNLLFQRLPFSNKNLFSNTFIFYDKFCCHCCIFKKSRNFLKDHWTCQHWPELSRHWWIPPGRQSYWRRTLEISPIILDQTLEMYLFYTSVNLFRLPAHEIIRRRRPTKFLLHWWQGLFVTELDYFCKGVKTFKRLNVVRKFNKQKCQAQGSSLSI